MKQDDYFKKIKEVGDNLVSPSSYLKQRVMNNSDDIKQELKKNKLPSALFMMALLVFCIFAISPLGDESEQFSVGQNYIANFNLNDLSADNISYVELELPDNINLVSNKLKDKKKIIFVWSVFSKTKIVSFPFRANEKGRFDLKVKLLNDNMEVINVRSMQVDISKG